MGLILADLTEVEIKRYHADNVRFLKQAFRSEIEDTNHNITFCGVGSHHQNANFERKLQNLTLVARTLLLYAKIYWPEEITTMLCTYNLKAFA